MARTQIIDRTAAFLIPMTVLISFAGPRAEAADLDDLLLSAARSGDSAQVEAVLEHGAAVDASNEYGGTAISLAIGWGHRDIVTHLREAGQQKDNGPYQMVFALAIGLIGVVATPILSLGALKRAVRLSPREVGLAAAHGFAHKL